VETINWLEALSGQVGFVPIVIGISRRHEPADLKPVALPEALEVRFGNFFDSV
jgi:hypothetical protein